MMNDPLANIGQDDMAAQQGAPGEGLSHKKEIFDPMVHGVNLHRIERIRSVMGIAAGTIAGIIGLTGLDGLCKSFCDALSRDIFIGCQSIDLESLLP